MFGEARISDFHAIMRKQGKLSGTQIAWQHQQPYVQDCVIADLIFELSTFLTSTVSSASLIG